MNTGNTSMNASAPMPVVVNGSQLLGEHPAANDDLMHQGTHGVAAPVAVPDLFQEYQDACLKYASTTLAHKQARDNVELETVKKQKTQADANATQDAEFEAQAQLVKAQANVATAQAANTAVNPILDAARDVVACTEHDVDTAHTNALAKQQAMEHQ